MKSGLYIGSVVHRRMRPVVHHFRYRAFWLLIDLDEIGELSDRLRLFAHNRPNLFSLYDIDHGDGSATPLRTQATALLAQVRIDIGAGAIRLLCMPRTAGYDFNPLSIYFCHDADGALVGLIYEVHNTFGERHSYVLPTKQGASVSNQQCLKRFYVSPFMDMNLQYKFRVATPGQRVAVAIDAYDHSGRMFHAALAGLHRELTDVGLLRAGFLIPLVTLKVVFAIHWEALRLWLRGMSMRPRPNARVQRSSRHSIVETE